MKVFLCSLTVFCLLIAGVVCNAIYINRTTDELIALTKNVPEDSQNAETALAELSDYWQSHRGGLAFSVSSDELNQAEEYIACMQVWQKQGRSDALLVERTKLLSAIDEIRRLERMKIENLF